MTKVLLVRHGESQANRKKIFAGHYDVELEEQGKLQAERTAEYIVENFDVEKVYASDLKRAYQTAEATAKKLNLSVIGVPELREISAGDWEGVSFSELCEKYKEDYAVWLNDIGKAKCTNGESVEELGKRVFSALTKIAEENDGKTVLVATHATPIRAMECLIKTESTNNMKDCPWVSNTSVSVLVYENKVWRIEKMGYDEHLKDLKTALPANV